MDVLDVSADSEVYSDIPPSDASPPAGGTLGRVLAALAGLLVLGLAMFVTLGGAVLAPIGMWLASIVLRQRRRRLTLWASWVGAVGTVCLVLLLVLGTALAATGGDTIAKIQRTMDSSTAAQRTKPQPAWVERMTTPGSRARSEAMQRQMQGSHAFTATTLVFGGIIAIEFFAAFIGTLGWAAGLLLYYAVRGRWLR